MTSAVRSALLGAAPLAAATLLCCLSGDESRPLGSACASDGGCAAGLLCRYGRCRSECGLDRDCPGGRCVEAEADPAVRLCSFADEVCAESCPAGQTCVGGLCLADCEGVVCGPGRTCTSGACLACVCDVDGDGHCDSDDLELLDSEMERTDCAGATPPCAGDLNGDGDVDASDLALYSSQIGSPECQP